MNGRKSERPFLKRSEKTFNKPVAAKELMAQISIESHRYRSFGITFLAVVNAIGFVVTILFWATVFLRHLVPFPGDLTALADRANSAVTYGFMAADMLYSAPLLFLACLGLWRRKSWGWLAAQMVNALWIFSMTVILIRDAYTTISPGGLLFIPFTLIAIWAIPFLWMHREDFGIVG
jgi:hypothetical protein